MCFPLNVILCVASFKCKGVEAKCVARQRPQSLAGTWATSVREATSHKMPGAGDAGTYVPKGVLDAGEAEGLALEYYKSYDTRALEGLGMVFVLSLVTAG